jgi:hypothetical protein
MIIQVILSGYSIGIKWLTDDNSSDIKWVTVDYSNDIKSVPVDYLIWY